MDTTESCNKKRRESGYFGDNKLMGIEWGIWKLRLFLDKCRGRRSESSASIPNSPNPGSLTAGARVKPDTPSHDSSGQVTASPPRASSNPKDARDTAKASHSSSKSAASSVSADVATQGYGTLTTTPKPSDQG